MISRTAKVIAAVIAGFLLIVLAVNSWDEELRPEVQAVIDQKKPPTENGLKAFYYLLGLRIGDAQNAEAEGQSLWAESQKLPSEQRDKFLSQWLKKKDGVWPSLQFSPRLKGQSAADFLKEAQKNPERLPDYQNLTDPYLKLIFHDEYTAPEFDEAFSRAETPVAELLKGHRLLTLRMGALAEKKLYEKMERVIREENRFYQSFFGRTHLLGVMIAHLIIEDNADILAIEKEKNPKLKFKAETLASFVTPSAKEMLNQAMSGELRFFAKMAKEMSDGSLLTAFSDPTAESLLSLDKLKTRVLIKRNATINRYYDQVQAELNSPCEEDCLWDKPWWKQGLPLTLIRNPGGKWMTRILMINVHGRAERMGKRTRRLEEILAQLKA